MRVRTRAQTDRIPAALAALVLLGVLGGAGPVAGAEPAAELLFASDLLGDLHARECGAAERARPGGLLGLATAVAAAKARSSSPGSALVIGGAGLLGPGGGARYLLHSVTGSRTAANLLRGAGIEIVSPGVPELAIARETLLGYFDQLRGSGPAALVSNLKCPDARPELCRLVAARHVVSRGGLRIGLLAALPEDAPQRVGPGHLHGAAVAAWPELVKAAKPLRAEADVLVLMLDLSRRFGLDEALELLRSLEAAGVHVDVAHLSRQDDARGGVLSLQLSSGTIVVGSPAGGAGVTRVSVTRRGEAGAALELRTERVLPAGPPPPLLAEALERERAEMCTRWGAVLGNLPKEGLDRAAVTRLILDAMRRAARAEIALINSGAIADRGLPLRAATVHAVGEVLPFKAQVLVGTQTGEQITDALRKYAAQGPEQLLRVAGLSVKSGSLLVNGRPISPASRYRVATIDFVAAGGGELLPEKFLPSESRSVVQDDLRALVLEALRQSEEEDGLAAPLRLERRPVWSAGSDLGVDLQSVTVHNPDGAYDRPLLSRQPSFAFKLDGTARAEMDQPRHLVQLTLRTVYGQSWLYTSPTLDMAGMAAPKEWLRQETSDLINLLGLYSFRGLSEKRLRLPTPYVSLGLESEFSRPDTRAYHHLELSGAVGLRVALPAGFSANLGIGVRSELLADRDSTDETERDLGRARFLLTTTLELPKRPLWKRLGNSLLGELLISYSFTDPLVLRSHELRGLGKLYLELSRPLYLTVGTELYLYRDRDREAGVALDLTAGLKVTLSGRKQQF